MVFMLLVGLLAALGLFQLESLDLAFAFSPLIRMAADRQIRRAVVPTGGP